MVIAVCGWCHKPVRVNKPLFGSLHLCLTDEEQAVIAQRRWQAQMDAQFGLARFSLESLIRRSSPF